MVRELIWGRSRALPGSTTYTLKANPHSTTSTNICHNARIRGRQNGSGPPDEHVVRPVLFIGLLQVRHLRQGLPEYVQTNSMQGIKNISTPYGPNCALLLAKQHSEEVVSTSTTLVPAATSDCGPAVYMYQAEKSVNDGAPYSAHHWQPTAGPQRASRPQATVRLTRRETFAPS